MGLVNELLLSYINPAILTKSSKFKFIFQLKRFEISNSVEKLIYCFREHPGEIIAVASVSLLNFLVMQDSGTEFVALQRFSEQISTCYQNYDGNNILHQSQNNTFSDVGQFS